MSLMLTPNCESRSAGRSTDSSAAAVASCEATVGSRTETGDTSSFGAGSAAAEAEKTPDGLVREPEGTVDGPGTGVRRGNGAVDLNVARPLAFGRGARGDAGLLIIGSAAGAAAIATATAPPANAGAMQFSLIRIAGLL
jgi:hypothetical protein